MKYVDGFVLAVKNENLEAYKKMAGLGGKAWMKHGALEYFECTGDDMTPDMGGMKALTFPELTGLKDDETVIFSFIVYESKEHRDKVNAAVMKDMEKEGPSEMPFDIKRMAYGGFKAFVEERQKQKVAVGAGSSRR
jgi:uncharacterized protein YbaA (DUF1428 family)